MKRQVFSVLFLFLFSSSLLSQTLKVNPGKILDAENKMHFSFELDSILKYESYTSEELKSDPLTITFKKAETFGYNEREGKFYYESIEYQFENKTIQLSHEDNTYKYSFKSDDSYLAYFEIPKDELLYNIEFEIEFPNNKFTNNDFFDINTNKIVGLTNGGSTFQLYFKEGLDESQYTNVLFYNTITSNIDDLVEEVNSDIVLNIRDCGTPHCDRWKGNALMNLDRPIVKDFTGDGVNDIVGRTYTHYFGDIDWQLTEDEKKMYFSRWVLLEGIKSITVKVILNFIQNMNKLMKEFHCFQKIWMEMEI